ncbi:copper chaperone PCu(A)C [Paracoccus gahaiensis]|uniref:Copper chaperone PCu(A)C n=1 Tax=Paracoccus gahaiensis TaxID=1706839 RepID=A0A4U0R7U8_9RHOB|nr:copper chaperone PCu(A)C [Paracoccus gahaiensis]TJZ90470.1 copper chaperone PCu(A)C [Paracoccus gahaiensis]
MKTLTLAAIAALLPVTALAHDGMHINDAYVRSTNPQVGAVFLQLENHRQVPCTLHSVTTKAAERAELHTHLEEDGVMKMGRIEGGIPVEPGQTHDLARGGDHVMLLGLTDPLTDGDSLTLTLDFGDCGTEEAEAVVDNQRSPEDAAAASEADPHAGH